MSNPTLLRLSGALLVALLAAIAGFRALDPGSDPAVRPDADDPPEESAHDAEWRHFNERCAGSSLKTLTSAEEDFVANDRDGSRVEDFWKADVKGLYTLNEASAP